VKFVATKKSLTTIFFSPLSFVAVLGSEIRDPEWVKIRIRDKHPGSATLVRCCVDPELFWPLSGIRDLGSEAGPDLFLTQ
jgi:hypothetical protein